MRYTEKTYRYKKITESSMIGDVYEVFFKKDTDIDAFLKECSNDILEYVYSTKCNNTLYLQLESKSTSKKVEPILKRLKAKVKYKESGYNSDPRSLMRQNTL